MREHQIVITLKPDQFLEVQRLARAANAKSMGAFVRQKLLAALGIEGSLSEDPHAQISVVADDVDVEAILGDLKRVHSELKGFVAESLSPYSAEAFGQTVESTVEQAPQVVAPAEVTSLNSQNPDQDELEKLADRTFAISPRLGPIGEPTGDPKKRLDYADRPSVAEKASAADPAQTSRSSNDDNRILLSRHELHSRRDSHRYHSEPTQPLEAMDQSFTDESPAQPLVANGFDEFMTEAPIEDAPPAVPYIPVTSSPTSSLPVVDPLSKLLSKEDMMARTIPKSMPIDDDDEAFDVPLSIAERRRLLDDTDEPRVYKEPPHPALQPTLQSDMPLESAAPAPEAAPIANEVSSSPPAEIAPAETGTTTASPAVPPVQNDLGRPLGYPPLSGSPPPKRRQV
jgi:hypothetical protein